jgi:hypothetical protein
MIKHDLTAQQPQFGWWMTDKPDLAQRRTIVIVAILLARAGPVPASGSRITLRAQDCQ